jgi:agmatinase
MSTFDPNAASSVDSGIFGLPFTEQDASLVFVPVPWEATTSYGGGTSNGPGAILNASKQVDLFDLEVLRPYEAGFFMREESAQVRAWNEEGKAEAARIIEVAGQVKGDARLERALARVNELGGQLNAYVAGQTREVLAAGKIPAIVGGDHSVPFGALLAVAERENSFGVLHFDAHSDTRNAYEGFQWSHASIFHNVLERVPQVTKLVQVGIRDVCEEEVEYCRKQGSRVRVFFDLELSRRKQAGENFQKVADEIVASLPEKIWVSFDIDGLDPRFCPHTGTPVPGGLDFHEANAILRAAVRAGKKIIGFDLNEVAPHPEGLDEWDANVGARLLYKLSAWTLASQRKAQLNDILKETL